MSDLGTETPSSTHRFFIYDPDGWGFRYFDSSESRDAAKDSVIQSYLDDGWDESVEQVIAGEVTHTCKKVGVVMRPPAVQLDADQCAADGTYWGEHEYRCGYDLLPLIARDENAVAAPDHAN